MIKEEDYKREILLTYLNDPRPWIFGKCREACWCGMVWPADEDVNKTMDGVASGVLSLNEAEFLALAHNIIPAWREGLDVVSDWQGLLAADARLDPRKWRYRHCWAVRKKRQDACWCREVIPVGRLDPEEDIVSGACGGLPKAEARLFVLMHNFIRDYKKGHDE